jgi:glycosyltransferase involved in cell wall biosynthesis
MLPQARPKVLLVIPHLGGGGAERVIAILARELPSQSSEKYEVHLALVTGSAPAPEEFGPSLQIHALNAARVRSAALPLLRLIRQLKPALILSGIFHLNFLVLLLRSFFPAGTRILVRQNGTVSASLAYDRLPWYTSLLYRLLYRRADRIICQTQAMANDLSAELHLAPKRLAVLCNPIDVEEIRKSISQQQFQQQTTGPLLLAVGRLSPEKGFDLLLQAFALVRKTSPQLRLLIAGTGPQETALKAQSAALGLDSAVTFAGHLPSPWQYFPTATLFVLPSRHEGMPNALLEAAAAGLPIVALPASGGVVELLRDQPGVWLAPQVSAEALAASLLSALQTLQPGQRFAHAFIDGFRLDRAMRAYENLIDQTLAKEP